MLKFMVGVLIEHYLEGRYFIPLFEAIGFKEFKGSIYLSIHNTSQGFTGDSSSNPSLNDLSTNLIPSSPGDKVVLKKHGLSITDTFITNVQTKLYRGMSNIIGTYGITAGGISFLDAIYSVNTNYRNNALGYAYKQKIKLLLAEKGIYRAKASYNKVPLSDIRTTTSNFDHKNITAVSR